LRRSRSGTGAARSWTKTTRRSSVEGPRPPRPRKRFGQHFLEPAWIEKVVAAIDPRSDETFIEIGPGRGALTSPLAARARRVITVEIDRDLAGLLHRVVPPNVTVVEGDFLKIADSVVRTADDAPLRVAANLPYNVAAPILFELVDRYLAGAPIVDATVMLQREVADRLAAVPGSREYGVLSVLVQHAAAIERLLDVPAGAFRPAPTVRSAVVRLRFHPLDPPVRDRRVFEDVVRAVFTRRRKTLANALLAWNAVGAGTRNAPTRDAARLAGIDPGRRPETLAVAEFARLADGLTK
jgi:16S rRNA (adenine1518-N6/adenine1519-N6)-dimethyltransferase